ncbi:MAG: hypothetical protein ACSLE6_17665 [Mycobacterium sp.]
MTEAYEDIRDEVEERTAVVTINARVVGEKRAREMWYSWVVPTRSPDFAKFAKE